MHSNLYVYNGHAFGMNKVAFRCVNVTSHCVIHCPTGDGEWLGLFHMPSDGENMCNSFTP